MRKARTVRCNACGDTFIIEADSRDVPEIRYTCRCGKLRGYYNTFFTDQRGFSANEYLADMGKDEINYFEFLYPEDILTVPNKTKRVMRKIEKIGVKLGKNDGCVFRVIKNGSANQNIEYRFQYTNICTDDIISINAEANFVKTLGWKESDISSQLEKIYSALNKYLKVLKSILRGYINLKEGERVYENKGNKYPWYTKWDSTRWNNNRTVHCWNIYV